MPGGSWQELLYASTTNGTARSNFTTETVLNDTAGAGVQCYLPQGFFAPNQSQVGRALKIVARGILSSTGTPSFTLRVRGGSAASITGGTLLETGAMTTTSGATNQPWQLEGDVVLSNMGLGTNTTFRGTGLILSPGLNPVMGTAIPAATSIDTTVTNFINVTAQCSVANAANSITLIQLMVYSLN